MVIPQRGGLPHSDIHGSKPARGSPWLFAACHVLHRLLVPRHPPNALLALHAHLANPQAKPGSQPANPPCTGTITGTRTARSAAPHRAKRQTSSPNQIKRPSQGKHSGQHRVGHPYPINSAQLSTPLNSIAMPGGTTLGRNASRRRNHDPFRSDNHPASQRATSHGPAQRLSASQTSEMPCAPRSAPEPDSQ